MVAGLHTALHRAGFEADVSGRGIRTLPEAAPCIAAARAVHRLGGVVPRPVQLTAADVELADLVLVASATERSALARLRPDARSRVFTLREAAAAASLPMTPAETEWFSVVADGDRFGAYVELLHRRRPVLELPSRRLPFRDLAGFDIPDAHGNGHVSHQRLFAVIQRATEELAAGIIHVSSMRITAAPGATEADQDRNP
jgi:protein-tyrosine phosphatase